MEIHALFQIGEQAAPLFQQFRLIAGTVVNEEDFDAFGLLAHLIENPALLVNDLSNDPLLTATIDGSEIRLVSQSPNVPKKSELETLRRSGTEECDARKDFFQRG
jgi:hypothetical protein